MGATGFTTGDPQKVDVTGDSMTGDLTLAGSGTDLSVGGNLTVTGSTQMTGDVVVSGLFTGSYEGVSANFLELVATMLSTGTISGGQMTVNTDPSKVDISALVGYVVDYNSSAALSPTNPIFTRISLPAQTGLSLTGPPTQITTWWLVNSSGTIVQQAANPTPEQRRTHLVLGATAQFSGFIFIVQTLPGVQSQPNNQLSDLMDGLGPFVLNNNPVTITANGANLGINTSGGRLFARSFSQVSSYLNPHSGELAAQTPASFRWATATTVLPTVQNTIDVSNYDPNGSGVVTAIPGGANTATIHRVYAFASATTNDQMSVQYGQTTYASLSNALAAVGAGTFTPNPLFTDGALIAYIVAIKSATNLSDTAQCVIVKAGKFATP